MIRIGLFLAAPALLWGQLTIKLGSDTSRAFDGYVTKAEASMNWQARALSEGDNTVAATGTTPVDAPAGLIHDWVASEFVPGASIAKALAMFQDYGAYKRVFAPDVIDAEVAAHTGNNWQVRMRIQRKKPFTLVFNTGYEIEYRPLGNGRWAILSRSTKVAEVERGKELPAETGHGYLWRLNSYWLLEPRSNGLYMECRTISLSRDIPAGLAWAIKPAVSTLPRDSLRATVRAASAALR